MLGGGQGVVGQGGLHGAVEPAVGGDVGEGGPRGADLLPVEHDCLLPWDEYESGWFRCEIRLERER